jgi:NADH/NAD ratio-sensing transcriptional regulator Rex
VKTLNQPMIERLVHLHHFIQLLPPSTQTVPSREMARQTDVDASLIRKDLAAIGVHGRKRVGYPRRLLLRAI